MEHPLSRWAIKASFLQTNRFYCRLHPSRGSQAQHSISNYANGVTSFARAQQKLYQLENADFIGKHMTNVVCVHKSRKMVRKTITRLNEDGKPSNKFWKLCIFTKLKCPWNVLNSLSQTGLSWNSLGIMQLNRRFLHKNSISFWCPTKVYETCPKIHNLCPKKTNIFLFNGTKCEDLAFFETAWRFFEQKLPSSRTKILVAALTFKNWQNVGNLSWNP